MNDGLTPLCHRTVWVSKLLSYSSPMITVPSVFTAWAHPDENMRGSAAPALVPVHLTGLPLQVPTEVVPLPLMAFTVHVPALVPEEGGSATAPPARVQVVGE